MELFRFSRRLLSSSPSKAPRSFLFLNNDSKDDEERIVEATRLRDPGARSLRLLLLEDSASVRT